MKATSSSPLTIEGCLAPVFSETLGMTVDQDRIVLTERASGGPAAELIFDKAEYVDDLAAVKFYRSGVIVTQNSVVFLLHDPDRYFQGRDLRVTGRYRGTISANVSQKALVLVSARDVFDLKNLEQKRNFEQLLVPNIVVAEIQIDDALPYGEDSEVEILVNTLIMDVAFRTNCILNLPGWAIPESKAHIVASQIETIVPHDLEPVLYFNSAERIAYPHLQYLEYYHILEYYFFVAKIEKMEQILAQAVSVKLQQRSSLEEKDYYKLVSKLAKSFLEKSPDREEEHLKEIIQRDLGFDAAYQLLRDQFPDFKFLGQPVMSDLETKIELGKLLTGGTANMIDTISPPDREAFLNSLAKRIYRIRNYIVHTKKGERDIVFKPGREDFDKLANDLVLIRSVSYSVLKSHCLRRN